MVSDKQEDGDGKVDAAAFQPVHVPVLIEEVVQFLAPPTDRESMLIDATLGEGGHTERFLHDFPLIRVCGIDADAVMLGRAKQRLAPYASRVEFVRAWHGEFFKNYPLSAGTDRILIDLGISIFHYTGSGRGFSFMQDEVLDMRLSADSGPSLASLLAGISESELYRIIYEYGEERHARRIARAIVAYRQKQGGAAMLALKASELARIIFDASPAEARHGRLHPATRSFQALRIVVNRELEGLGASLEAAFDRLLVGGRLGVISFHSLEDRIVKHVFRELAKTCHCPPELPRCVCDRMPYASVLTTKPLEAGEEEKRVNPPSRSAKLRVLEKLRPRPGS